MALTLFVMIDGMRPDALAQVRCSTLDTLRARGASTLQAQSVMPSVTLPCHMSMFHSVPPTRHGVTTNTWTPMARPLPGLIEIARTAGRRCAAFYNWEPLRNVSQPEHLHLAYFHDNLTTFAGDDEIANVAANTLAGGAFDFAFVYLGTVDVAGHAYGWMSPEYLAQIERVDVALGGLLAALPDDTSVLVHSDHGGHERTHGTDMPEDMTIPWIIAGPAIRRQYAISTPVSLIDTAPTLARLLGLASPVVWEGHCVNEAFLD